MTSEPPTFYRTEPDGLVLSVRVSPKASRSAITSTLETDTAAALKVAVTAAPEKGRANDAVIALLAKTFGVAKRDVTLVSGATDRRKVLRIAGDPTALAAIADQWRTQ